MKKANCYVYGLKPSVRKEMFEELQRMPRNVSFKLIDIRNVTAAKWCYQRASVEHLQAQQSINIRTNEKGLPTFMYGDTPEAPSAGSTLPEKQGQEYHLHPLDSVRDVLKLEEVFLLEYLLAVDDLNKLLQQQDSSGCRLLQDYEYYPSVSESQLTKAMLVVSINYSGHNLLDLQRTRSFYIFLPNFDWKQSVYFVS